MAPYSLWLDATRPNTVWQVAADQQSKKQVVDGPQIQWMQAILAVNGYNSEEAAVHSAADPTIAAWLNAIPVAA